MSTKECCRTCDHCRFSQTPADSWCQLRQLRVHPELAAAAVCHHWTQRAPALPKIQEEKLRISIDRQLELGRPL